jgi:hypothetical protein
LLAWVQLEPLSPHGICDSVVTLTAQGEQIAQRFIAKRWVSEIRRPVVPVVHLERRPAQLL